MRQERDALGDWSIDEDAFYGIATARLVSAVNIPGPAFPPELPGNLLRIRQAQAVAFGRSRQWPDRTAAALAQAAARLAAVPERLAEQIRVTPLHGGGARSLVLNLDEVLANAALLEIGANKGDYHLMAPLFQLDRGLQPLSVYMTSFHITMLAELSQLLTAAQTLSSRLERQTLDFSGQETVAQLQYQDVELSTLGSDFSRCGDSIGRSRLRLEQVRAALIPCWQGTPEVLPVLRELTGLELAVRRSPDDFPRNTDLYVELSSQLKNMALALLQFCSRLRVLAGQQREIGLPRLRANPAFSPAQHEFVALDTAAQLGFAICGADAATTAAIQCGLENAGAYAPLFTTEIFRAGRCLSAIIRLLSEQVLPELTGTPEAGRTKAAATPLQAERLIPLLGYERAVQVARIAALTEKPVRLVVEKMKLLSADQLAQCFEVGESKADRSADDTEKNFSGE